VTALANFSIGWNEIISIRSFRLEKTYIDLDFGSPAQGRGVKILTAGKG
jgi:hypothetical protein